MSDAVRFDGRKVLYSWIGGTRRDWRGQGHFRALTEESEAWAHASGFHEVVVKTKNRFYDMRGTLDQLEFNVVKYEPHRSDNRESKVYLSKRLTSDVVRAHTSTAHGRLRGLAFLRHPPGYDLFGADNRDDGLTQLPQESHRQRHRSRSATPPAEGSV